MKQELPNKFLKCLALIAAIGAFACGGGASSGSDSGSVSALGPGNPEDVFDFPNTLPNSFQLTSCPDLSGSGVTNVHDLEIRMSTPDGRLHDFDGDGDMDSVLLDYGDTQPKTVIFEIYSINNEHFPLDIVEPLGTNAITGGWQYDQNMVSQANPVSGDFPQSFGSDLLLTTWVPDYSRPIARQYYIPGVGPTATTPFWDPFGYGFEGCQFGDCATFGTALPPGVHMFAAAFVDTLGVQHCTRNSFRILICPVAGHC